MEDFDFDKLYADKMKRAGAPDFSDEDWERLLPRLDRERYRRWRMLPLWWLGVLSGLLLCSNIGWWLMWQHSENYTKNLQKEWQEARRELITQNDTSWKKMIVYQYDTIYRTIVYNTPTWNKTPSIDLKSAQKNSPGYAADNIAAVEKQMEAGLKTADLPDPKSIEIDDEDQEPGTTARFGNFEMLALKMGLVALPEMHFKIPEKEPIVSLKKRKTRPHIFTPRKFRLGAEAGIMIPRSKYLTNTSGFVASLTGEIVFSEQLALTLEGAYSGVVFKGTSYEQKLGLPPQMSPGDDYVLKYFETEEGVIPIYQLTTGMRYWMRPKRIMSPYLAIGLGVQWHPEYELKLEYINTVTENEKEISIEVLPTDNPVPMLDFGAGIRFRFSPHWYWQTGVDYQFKLVESQPGIPRFWGFRSGVTYGF